MPERVYADWNATAPLRTSARDAMASALELGGNASSIHAEGRKAKAVIENAREQVAALLGTRAANVVFTASGTEANVTALTPAIGCDRLFVSAIEHPSVRAGGRFAAGDRQEVPVSPDGVIDLGALKLALNSTKHPLVSVMASNNETGVVQPVHEVGEIVHEAGGLLHCDATQYVGRVAGSLPADLVTISAHKLGGPQGAGALVLLNNQVRIDPLLTGGGQERNRRAGTENVAAIAGFGAAAAAVLAAQASEARHMLALRQRFEAGLRAATPDVTIFGEAAARLPNTTLFALPGVKAETAVIAFDLEGVAVSSGSACSSGKVAASHVLTAMSVAPDLVRAAIRVSFGHSSPQADVDRVLAAWNKVVSSLAKEQRTIAA